MIRTKLCQKVFDSSADPFITQKGVILCRSGKQIYTASEVQGFITDTNKPPVAKDFYVEYRPASVIVKAKKLYNTLPVTKEHPMEFVDSVNFNTLAGGVTGKDVEVVALDGEAEGEIGLKSDITFFTDELYQYYLNNKEVSVGYECRKHFVPNPEEVGYDIILDEITVVNHLAITRAGRGGSKVAVIDSLIGGMKPMRTGIFAHLFSKKQKDSAPVSFGKSVFDSIKESKGTMEEELAGEMKGVLDSCAVLKDCEEKTTLINAVKDCFDNKEQALANEAELVATLDSMFEKANAESLKGFEVADSDKKEEPAEDSEAEKKEEPAEDSEAEKKEEPAEDSEAEKKEDEAEKKEEPAEDSKEADKEKDGCNKDSAPAMDSDAIAKAVKDSLEANLKGMVEGIVKDCLGLKKEDKPSVEGSEIDSADAGNGFCVDDYESFING